MAGPTSAEIILTAQDLLASSWGLEPDEWESVLSSWLGDADGKLERLAALRRASQARVATLEQEINRLQTEIRRANRAEAFATTSATGILEARRDLGHEPKVVWLGGKAWLQNGAPVVVIVPGTALPAEYVRTTTITETDKPKLVAALKAGAEIPGCSLKRPEFVRFG